MPSSTGEAFHRIGTGNGREREAAGCFELNCLVAFRLNAVMGPIQGDDGASWKRRIAKEEAYMYENNGSSRRRPLKMSRRRRIVSFDPVRPENSRSAGIVPTSEQVIGPFYPVTKPLDQDGDLTMIKGRPGKAQGQFVYLSGRVLDLSGKPIANAKVEMWQANTFGRYTHPGDSNPVPLDPSFEGHGVCITNTDGMYSFKTVKPGAYPAAEGRMRPPHIHFLVTAGPDRLVTQMYFSGEPLNETDELLGSAENREGLIAKVAPASKDAEPGAVVATWDIVLAHTRE